MQHSECASALRPHQNQGILAEGNALECFAGIVSRLHGFAIHLEDEVAPLQACIVSRTSGLDVSDQRSGYVFGSLQFLADVRSDIGQSEAPAWLASVCTGRNV